MRCIIISTKQNILRIILIIILVISTINITGCTNKSYQNNADFEYITLSSDDINNSLNLAIKWLISNLNQYGFYNHIYNYIDDDYIDDNNIYHKFKNTLLLSKLSSINSTVKNLHKNNLKYVIENYYHENNSYGYIKYDNKSELLINAIFLRAILLSPYFDDYNIYAIKLSNTILSKQNEDGSFLNDYLDKQATLLNINYSSEIIISLIEIYNKTLNEIYLEKAILAQEYYNNYLTNIDKIYYGTLIPGNTKSLFKLYQIKHEDFYLSIIKNLNDIILNYQIRYGSSIGHFDNLLIDKNNYSFSSIDGLITEGLLYSYDLLKLNISYNISNYKIGLILGAYNLIKLQYKGINEKVEGAIKYSNNTDIIRIDSTQNSIDTFLKILDTFDDEYWNYSYYPELNLLVDNVEKSRLSNKEVWYALFYGTIISIIIIFFIYIIIKKIKI